MSQAHSSPSSLFTRCGLAKQFPAVVEERKLRMILRKAALSLISVPNSDTSVFIRSRQVRYYDGVAGVCC